MLRYCLCITSFSEFHLQKDNAVTTLAILMNCKARGDEHMFIGSGQIGGDNFVWGTARAVFHNDFVGLTGVQGGQAQFIFSAIGMVKNNQIFGKFVARNKDYNTVVEGKFAVLHFFDLRLTFVQVFFAHV